MVTVYTPQRLSILQALHEGGHLSPGQVSATRRATGMTETTVYRTLEFLAENGVVNPTQISGGHLTYELVGHDHHHLVCRACGASCDLRRRRSSRLFPSSSSRPATRSMPAT